MNMIHDFILVLNLIRCLWYTIGLIAKQSKRNFLQTKKHTIRHKTIESHHQEARITRTSAGITRIDEIFTKKRRDFTNCHECHEEAQINCQIFENFSKFNHFPPELTSTLGNVLQILVFPQISRVLTKFIKFIMFQEQKFIVHGTTNVLFTINNRNHRKLLLIFSFPQRHFDIWLLKLLLYEFLTSDTQIFYVVQSRTTKSNTNFYNSIDKIISPLICNLFHQKIKIFAYGMFVH